MTSMTDLKENEIKVLAALSNNQKLTRDISLSLYDGHFHPTKIYGVRISKKIIRNLQRFGFVEVLLVYCLGLPELEYRLTPKGKRFIEFEVHDA